STSAGLKWHEVRDDLGPPRLQERRQHDGLAECGLVLVHRETGAVRGDLEEDSIRLAEVQAPEPEAVHLAAVRDPERVQALGPGLVILVRSAERDVMHAARA